ncbi:hypothetical protein GCM10023231_00200 [Olivibacter ginsenosidimutans]|uniref:Uncharacterized protein n=1 Tax=Olivibacter ginsenosidimutans TaxID=1176537 RepID=A0ABP9AAK2_9SPHI
MQTRTNRKQNRIPLKKAQKLTKRWRKFLKKQSGDYVFKTLNRGAFIPFEDIDALRQLEWKDKNIIGVRAYFALEKEKGPDDTPLHHVKLILVPVEKDGKNGRDVLEITTGEAGEDAKGKKSSIYDFTTPCPDCCDDDSPLY